MNRTARETLIREWHERLADVEKQIDALKEITGLSPESPLCASVMLMAHAYTLTVEEILARDNVGGWLEWWWLECNLGSKPLAASPSKDKPLRVIATIDDLIVLILGEPEDQKRGLSSHPRERALAQDAGNNDHEDDAA